MLLRRVGAVTSVHLPTRETRIRIGGGGRGRDSTVDNFLIRKQSIQMLFHSQRKLESIIQIRGLFKPSPSPKPTFYAVFSFRSCDPAYVLASIKSESFVSLFSTDEAEAVVADENTACAALSGISLHCLFEREDGGGEDGLEGFFVDGHLDGDVGEVGVDGG